MKVKDFNIRKIYSESSGVCSVVDSSINIQLNDYGIYDEIVQLDENQDLNPMIEQVSPSFNAESNVDVIAKKLYSCINNIQHDTRMGYHLSLYAGHVIEGDYRENGSSGGMGTWIFKELFENNLIDGVIHVKPNSDKNSPILFLYDISYSLEEIRAGAKTKYYPVEFSKVIQIVRETPGRYAIVGIPSFIMAIRLLAERDRLIRDRIKYTVGLICGHQKSSKFAEALAWQVGIKPGNLHHIDFRKKLLDRPASNYAVEFTGNIDGKVVTIIKPTNELLGQDWGQGFFKTTASDFSDDVMNETADITLGDAWLPEYTKDSKGNNVIIVRHPDIDRLIQVGMASGALQLDIVDNETIFRSQAAHYRHTRVELAYRLYKKDKAQVWRPLKRVAASKDIPFLRRKIQDLREEISTQSHMIYKEAVEMDDLEYFKTEMGKLSRKYQNIYKIMSIKNIGFNRILKAFIKRGLVR